jgi:peptidoglycan L-alanyl-D-glutamate endopeptidase CwlK
MNAISIARLGAVHPNLSYRIHQMVEMVPFDFEVSQGLRTYAEQDALYAQGRTSPGRIVTYASAGYSWHNFGLAADLVPEDITPGQPDWNLSNPVWAKLVSVAESLGLVSGAEWKGPQLDTAHVQLTGVFPTTPDDAVRRLFSNGGLIAVWNASGIE